MSRAIHQWLLLCAMSFSALALHGQEEPLWTTTPVHEAFVSRQYPAAEPLQAPRQPPASPTERIPDKAADDLVWISGYWAWVDALNDFRWVCGVWRRPPPGMQWISGEWSYNQGYWRRAPGFWSAVPRERLVYISTPPPRPLDDALSTAPGKDYFWIPGYWEYSSTTQQYSWLSGKWELTNPSWMLLPAAYIWRPAGYLFVPMAWDYPLEKRGQAFTCTAPGDLPTPLATKNILQQLLISYPDYLTLFWHWWQYHPGWWDSCWCLPPWWYWQEWWTLSWDDQWALWWWWGHPGSLPPSWMTLETSLEIAPPTEKMVEFFQQIPKPPFKVKEGPQPLRPQGPEGLRNMPRPQIPNDVTPAGTVTPPPRPNMPPSVPPKSPPKSPP